VFGMGLKLKSCGLNPGSSPEEMKSVEERHHNLKKVTHALFAESNETRHLPKIGWNLKTILQS